MILAAVLLSCLVSCGADNEKAYNAKYELSDGDYLYNEKASEDSIVSTEASTSVEVAQNRKIIEKIRLSVETVEFDELMNKLETEVADLGGYFEASSISGNSYDSYDRRNAELTIRIPKGSSGKFTSFMSENSTVTNKTVSTDDVTLQYVDTESRLSALNIEKEALENLLAKAKNVEDMISIRQRLTEVIYEIESYQSTLRTYDNLVDFTTVTVNVYEVKKTTIVEEQGTWEKIGTNLKNNFEDVGEGLVAFFVFLVSAIPYLIVIAVIVVVVIVICKAVYRRKMKNKKPENDEK